MACYHGGATTTIAAVHTDVIEAHILTKFDGPSLASAASTSDLLNNLCNNESLWKNICISTWNSIKHPLVEKTISTFPGGYRSFFSDAFPLVKPNPSRRSHRNYEGNTSEIISSVDIQYGNDQVYSKVLVTDTNNKSFLNFSFWIDLFDCNETVKIPLKFQGDEKKCMFELEKNLKLSWIVIDPTRKRAVNVSSFRPVSVTPYWNGIDVQVIYATLLCGDSSEFVECRVAATFGCKQGKEVKIRELSLCMEDIHMRHLSGEKSLRILEEAMGSGERKKQNEGEVKEMYVKYMDLKREEKIRRERRLNTVRRVSWVAYFFAFVFLCISLTVFPN